MKRVNMRTRVTVYTLAATISASGEKSTALVEYGQFWCAVRPRSILNLEGAAIENTLARYELTFRYSAKMAALSQDAEIKIDGRNMHVNGIDFGEFRKKYIKILASEVR